MDVGEDSAKSFIGKTPSSDDYEYLFDANDINEDFVVYGAYNEIEGRRDVVGAIRRSVFAGDERDTCINTIKKVKGKTDKRVNECPLEVTDEMIARWERSFLSFLRPSAFSRAVLATRSACSHACLASKRVCDAA